MSSRSILLLASAAALGTSVPALAQNDHHDGHHGEAHHGQMEQIDGRYDGAWEGEWSGEDTWRGEWTGTYTDAQGHTIDATYHGVFTGDHHFVSEEGHSLSHDGHGWREHHGRHGLHDGAHGRGNGPRFAYTAAERDQWLTDCQYLMADGGGYEDRRDRNGRLIGGLLGAVVGGVAGNRIAGGDRLLGTVAGAGLGGLAGAAIGSVLDGDGDGELSRNELWATRYCDAYLRRHELGGGEFGYGQQIRLVPVATHSQGRHGHRHNEDCQTCREVVTEEWIEIERPAPRPRPRPTPRPAPRPEGKLTPLS
ncbi:glycine zipper 2TM domain-containing protein [Aurantiacibacter marinus]|nr:glycine zipper 2TM domain-containing protein [Aurantiacibacter marinus]